MPTERDKDEQGCDCNRGREQRCPASPQEQAYAGQHVEKAAQKIKPQHEPDRISDLGTRGRAAKKRAPARPYRQRAKQNRYDCGNKGPARAANYGLADILQIHRSARPRLLFRTAAG